MRKLFLPLFLFSVFLSSAQPYFSSGRKSGVYTYIYKITAAEAQTLYSAGMRNVSEALLHTLVDSFAVEKPFLAPGNYLLVQAVNNKLHFNLQAAGDVQYKLINNNRDLVVALHTKEGNLLTDARAYINNRRLLYDAATQTYRIEKYEKDGLLQVYHQNVAYAFSVKTNYRRQQTFWQRMAQSVPLKYIINPVKKLFAKKQYRYNNYFYSTVHEQKFKGFMVFSKPTYKPGDTVRLKAFITTAKGDPIANKLLLRLTNRGFDVDSIIAAITPYRKGGYDYSFVLSDSLKMDLDKEYLLTLEEEKSRKYDLKTYDGDLDDEAYAAKRAVVMRGRFYYEDYELESILFSARSSKQKHSRGEEVAVYVKAGDENGMAVMDGRVQLIIKPSPYGRKEFSVPEVFLPDTLWQYGQALETLGETKINIPDSIFPKAGFDYDIECIFLNTNNERQASTLHQSFSDEGEKISFEQQNDSLYIEYRVKGKTVPAMGMLYGFTEKGDTAAQQTIRLPAAVKVHPFVKRYGVRIKNSADSYEVENRGRTVSALASRTKDSVSIRLVNPYGLPVWYTVFAGNKVLLQGLGNTLLYAEKVRTAKNYFLSLQYIYNDKVYNEDFTIPYQDKLLAVTIKQPDAVYPGQTAAVTIDVKDALGGPVANADVTAWSYTKKFTNAHTPVVPYLGAYHPGRKRYSTFRAEADKGHGNSIKLAWQRWSKEMHLDTIAYYKFLHPQTLYVTTEPAPDSITQVAPFIVVDGELQPVHHIYIDDVPVFFSDAQQLQRYSFTVSPGRHSFRFRTPDKLISLDSFAVGEGLKTFVSINADTANKSIRLQKMPEELTPYERGLWGRYMLLVENNFGENYAYINTGAALYMLNRNRMVNPVLAGPLPHRYAQLTVKNKFTLNFETEGGYHYFFQKGLIKQKQLKGPYPFPLLLSHTAPEYNFRDYVLTEKEIDSLWQNYLYNRSASEDLFTNAGLNKKGNGQLQIGITKDGDSTVSFIRNLLLFKYNDPDFLRIYRGAATDLGYIQPGVYRLMLLLKNDAYFIKDSITVKQNGLTYYQTGPVVPKQKDSVSIRISAIIDNRDRAMRWSETQDDFNSIKESFNEKYLDVSLLTRTISGIIRDDKGRPVAGATVTIKGTRVATVTGRYGRFTLMALPNSTIVVSTIGYTPEEKRLSGDDDYAFRLLPAKQNLEEVVVVGYGTSKKNNLTGSVSTLSGEMGLMGKVPGVMIDNFSPGSSNALRIGGASSFSSATAPLFIVDGLPFSGRMEDIDPSTISNVSVLSPDKATALYGSKGAGGVVLISTKKATETGLAAVADNAPVPGNSIRKNFRDDAWWQPKLSTNSEGKASFTVTYPDDITAWRSFAIAITDKKQSGYAERLVKSFKAISGSLSFPQFSVEGDSMTAIGKSLNYLMDSIQVTRSFYINNRLVKQGPVGFRNSWIDTFSVAAPAADSLKLKYTIQKGDGYFDGEERSIPVFKKGVLETTGFFAALRGDTSFVWQPAADTGTVKIYAETSALPVLEKEIEAVRRYEYLCNEQVASKLKALLVQKKIDAFYRRPFRGDKNINELIGRLSQSKSSSGLWGWWNDNEPMMWVSLHVLEALVEAQAAGYTTPVAKSVLTDYLLYTMESYQGAEKLSALHLLYLLGAKADYKKYLDSLGKEAPKMSLYEKLRLLELSQKAGLPVSLDSLLAKQSHTVFGNVYWGDEGYRFFDNAIQNTLVMYRILNASGNHNDLLEKIRSYFLERRRPGRWRNTYESSLIMETILPGLLVHDSLPQPATLTLSGEASRTIKAFPFSAEIKGGQKIGVSKQGGLPVYFTAYEQHWNAAPEKVAGDFAVSSYFEKAGDKVTQLKAGEPVDLKIAVSVKADAGYVMVEAPVPAGCSYRNKSQGYAANEVHREYFKNKVSIFCSLLKKGDYIFTIPLLPRYSGKYILNPAKAEMMYFPVFYGRDTMRKVIIQ